MVGRGNMLLFSYSFFNYLFPHWAVFLAGAFRFLASSSPSWGFAIWSVMIIVIMVRVSLQSLIPSFLYL